MFLSIAVVETMDSKQLHASDRGKRIFVGSKEQYLESGFLLLTRSYRSAVEVQLREASIADKSCIREAVNRFLEGRMCIAYIDGPLALEWNDHHNDDSSMMLSTVDPQLSKNVESIYLNSDGAADDDEGEEGAPAFKEWILPNSETHGLWDALHYDTALKQRLIKYATSALLFSERGVSSNLVSWNRVVLLHGPPGTGKTSMCKALAQKLAIRFGDRYDQASLIEVNAHSLFSKYFSESGKLVCKLFNKIRELVEDEDTLVFVLIDEVESLTAARKAGGSEPTDAIRAVNALLTSLDALKAHPNVMVLTTSNITGAIDAAFVDRADIKAYIGPPSLAARYEILRSSLVELIRAGIISGDKDHVAQLLPFPSGPSSLPVSFSSSTDGGNQELELMEHMVKGDENSLASAASQLLLNAATACEGFSGRSLRRLPFLAHAGSSMPTPCTCIQFIGAVREAAMTEFEDKSKLST
eukprot:gene5534-4168_t